MFHFLRQASIAQKLFIGFSAFILLVVAASIYGISRGHKISERMSYMAFYDVPRLTALHEMKASSITASSLVERMVLRSAELSQETDGIMQFQADYEAPIKKIVSESENLEKLAQEYGENISREDEPREHEVAKITGAQKSVTQKSAQLEQAISDGRIDDIRTLSKDLKSAHDALVVILTASIEQENQRFVAESKESDARTIVATQYGVGLIVLATMLAIILGWAITLSITRPLDKLQYAAQDISAGHYGKDIVVDANDEVGNLAKVFSTMSHEVERSYADLIKQNQSLISLENELKAERDQAQTIISSMGDGLVVVDHEQKIIQVNRLAARVLGLRSDQATGKRWFELCEIKKDGQSIPLDAWPTLLPVSTKEPVVIGVDDNFTITTHNGRTVPLGMTISVTERLGKQTSIIILRDLTAEKAAKESITHEIEVQTREVQEGRARLLASINSLKLGFIITDKELSILMMNSSAVEALCMRHDDDGTSSPSSTYSGCTLEDIDRSLAKSMELQKQLHKAMEEKKSAEFYNIPLGKSFFHIFLSPIILKNEVIGTVILVEDVTEQLILERSKDEFFSIASHELRTPLTAIRGNASMIRDYLLDDKSDPMLKDMVGDINSSCVRLIGIVNDFLDTTRLEQGKIEFKFSEFDIAELAKEVMHELEPNAQERKVELNVKIPDQPLPAIWADRDRAKQILINLVGNALKFTEYGEIKAEFIIDKEAVKVEITDTGKGISKENQNLLFRKFQQASDNILTRDTTRGTGLGLYISKLLAEGMGGKVSLEKSEVGKGSTFSATFKIHTHQIEGQPAASPVQTNSDQSIDMVAKKPAETNAAASAESLLET